MATTGRPANTWCSTCHPGISGIGARSCPTTPLSTAILAGRGEYTSSGKHAPASEEAKRCANSIVVEFTIRCASKEPRRIPLSGPLPDNVKNGMLAYQPRGVWTAMPPPPAEPAGPREVRFLTGVHGLERGAGVLLYAPYAFQPFNFLRFDVLQAGPNRILMNALEPDEKPLPTHKLARANTKNWDEVVYEFRLVVTPFGAYEALAEVNSPGFWRSPCPLLWAGPLFRTTP